VRKAITDGWIISMTAGMALHFYGYAMPGNPSLIALTSFESEIGTVLNARWQGPDLSIASTVRPFSSPIGLGVPSGFSGGQGFSSTN
jgi:hypothetical protein